MLTGPGAHGTRRAGLARSQALSGEHVREVLGQYRVRESDGLVQRYVASRSDLYGVGYHAFKNYWDDVAYSVPTVGGEPVRMASHSALFLALHDEVRLRSQVRLPRLPKPAASL